MLRGEVPYRDFAVEYPPGALLVFLQPARGNEGDEGAYRHSFDVLMAACGAALLIALAIGLAALDTPPSRMFGALALAALAPLLLGASALAAPAPLLRGWAALTGFALWPAALPAASLAALVSGRARLGHGLLGAGFVTKIWPGVLVPLAVAYVWRTRGRREALACLGI